MERIIWHEKFQDNTGKKGLWLQLPNDIALVRLREDLVFGPYVLPADISGSAVELPTGAKVTAIGLGLKNVTKFDKVFSFYSRANNFDVFFHTVDYSSKLASRDRLERNSVHRVQEQMEGRGCG